MDHRNPPLPRPRPASSAPLLIEFDHVFPAPSVAPLVATQAAEASRAADDVERRRRRSTPPQLPPMGLSLRSLFHRRCRYLRVRPVNVMGSLIKMSVLVVVFFAEHGSPLLVPNRMVTPSSLPRSSRTSSGSAPVGRQMSFLHFESCYSVPPCIL